MRNIIIVLLCLIGLNKIYSQQNRFGLFLSQSHSQDIYIGKQTTFEIGTLVDYRLPLGIKFLGDSIYTLSSFRYNVTASAKEKEKTDDLIYQTIENNIYGDLFVAYPVGWSVDPFVSTSFQSQPLPSFRENGNTQVQTGSFRDPITTIQTLGFAYKWKIDNMSNIITRLGSSLKQIRAKNFTMTTDDFTTPLVKENYKAEYGISLKSEIRLQLDSNSIYNANLDVFKSYSNKENTTVRMTNDLQTVFLKYLTVLVKIDLNFDEAQSKKVQFRQSMRFGILVNI